MTNKDLVAFCLKAKDKPVMYMWGDYGRPITESTIAAKAKQYPVHYSPEYQMELRSKTGTGIGCDCTGLIKWFLWTGGDIEKAPKYDGATDNSASGWYNVAKVRGKIEDIPYDRAGLIVSMKGHCGVYIGNGEVIECTKGVFGNGVVQTRLSDREWEKWCECKYIEYIEEPESVESEIVTVPARVNEDCPACATIDQLQQIGTVFLEDEILYLGIAGKNPRGKVMAVVIYPTAKSQKVAFVERSYIVF